MAARRIAVVGAGLAGLSAAMDLREAGCDVEVFERTRFVGGRATSYEIEGHEVDNGQHVFLHCNTEFIAFVERAGLKDALREQACFDALVLARNAPSGRLRAANLPAPLHLLASFANYAHLDLAGKLRIASALASAMLSKPNAGESFDAWLWRHGQDAATRRAFWDPFFIPAINAPFDRITASDALVVLRSAFLGSRDDANFGFSTVPLARVAQAAAKRVNALHLSTGVTALDLRDDGVRLELTGDREAEFDAVVLAVPPRITAKLLGDPERFGVRNLDTYDAYPILDVHVWHDRGTVGFDFAAALDSPLQWIFEKAPGYLCCSFSAATQYLTMPREELQRVAWSELQSFVPVLRDGAMVRGFVTRNPEATYIPRAGAPRTLQQSLHPALAIAGSWTETGVPDTMESAVRSGRSAAAVIVAGNNRVRSVLGTVA